MHKTYEIKLPASSWVALIVQLPVISLLCYSAVTGRGVYSVLTLVGILLSLFYICVLLSLVIRIMIQPRHMEIIEDKIVVGRKELSAVQINELVIQGYFSQIVGIKPKGKRLVPSLLCFKIKGNEEEATEEVIQWARQHGIRIKHGRIFCWI